MTRVFTSLNDDELVELLKNGAVGVMPTDTIYGLVCAADNEAAVRRLYDIKHRARQPGTTIAASIEQLRALGFPLRSLRAVEQLWPNALSVEMPARLVPDYLSSGELTMAVRIPRDDKLQALLAQTGPLMTTSANHPAEPTATDIAGARRYFGDNVDFYVDVGDLGIRPPSTIIRIIDDAIEIIREGAVKIDENGRITP